MKKKLIVFFILLCFRISFSTTIIAYQRNNIIHIGADSKHTVWNSGKNIDTFSKTKIHIINNFCFLLQGNWADSTINFETFITDQLKENSFGLTEHLKKIIDWYYSNFSSYYKVIKSQNSYYYQKIFKEKLVCKILICGIENKNPHLYCLKFIINNDGILDHDIMNFSNEKAYMYYLGQTEAIEQYLQENNWETETNPIDLINNLINLQIQTTPEFVRKPINIIKLDSKGYEWIQ
ncbi:hypothetical protein JXQ31_17170 [candidate division KSB1 bacterium]|nr:hypothetical protein [candidate division KSB1 bacterium]